MEKIRLTVHYRGQVQGVGFRWQTSRCLEELPVTGFVQNLPDGRVRLVLEGDEAATSRARARVREALDRYISGEDAETSPATGEFTDFGVRR